MNAFPVHTRSDFLNTRSDLRKSIHTWENLNGYGLKMKIWTARFAVWKKMKMWAPVRNLNGQISKGVFTSGGLEFAYFFMLMGHHDPSPPPQYLSFIIWLTVGRARGNIWNPWAYVFQTSLLYCDYLRLEIQCRINAKILGGNMFYNMEYENLLLLLWMETSVINWLLI